MILPPANNGRETEAAATRDGADVTHSPIVRENWCIGCGVCAGVCPAAALNMEVQGDQYRPVLRAGCTGCGLCMDVCPFGESEGDETTLAEELYADCPGRDALLGRFIHTEVGAVKDAGSRLASASGGAASLVLTSLLASGSVDAVVAPLPTREGFPWHEYRIVTEPEQVAASKGSVYHPVHLADVLREMLARPQRRYAVITVPCYAKALRKAARRIPALRRSLAFILGLTCGGGPTFAFALAQAMLAGVSDPAAVRHHCKMRAASAKRYGCGACDGQGRWRYVGSEGIGNFMWANRVFRKACFACDDVFAELADGTFMDAWLPEFQSDLRGHSLLILRRPELAELLERRRGEGQWEGRAIEPARVVESQERLCRHKRMLLAPRLEALRLRNRWAPPKRMALLAGADKQASPDAAEQSARRMLACDELAPLLGEWFAHHRGQALPPWSARLAGWRLCRRIAAQLRRSGVKPAPRRRALYWRGLTNLLQARAARPLENGDAT